MQEKRTTEFADAVLEMGIEKIDELRAERDRLKVINADLLKTVKDARLMLCAWRGLRRHDGLPDHKELNEVIEQCETVITREVRI